MTPQMPLEIWAVTGDVDTGAITFPIFKKVTAQFTAPDWTTALKEAPAKLASKGNGLSPVTVFKVERIKPRWN